MENGFFITEIKEKCWKLHEIWPKIVEYCHFFSFFPSLNFNKMHQKQERMDFLSPKEEKNAENCKKMPKNGQKTRKIPIFSLFLLLFSLLPPFPPSFPFLPPPSSPLSPFFGRVVKLLACGARGPGFDPRPRHLNFQGLVISCFQVEIWLKDR